MVLGGILGNFSVLLVGGRYEEGEGVERVLGNGLCGVREKIYKELFLFVF